MPVSIVDYAKLIKDPMSLGLFKNLVRMRDVLKVFPIVSADGFTVSAERWHTLPTHGFRKLNAGFTETTGTTDSQEDRLAIFGGEYRVDKALNKTKVPMLRKPQQVQFDMHSKAMERGIAWNIFRGDIDTTPDGFDGLVKRFSTAGALVGGRFPASQVIDCGNLNVLTAAAQAQQFCTFLDRAIIACDLGGSTVQEGIPRGAIFTNRAGIIGINNAFRLTGYSVGVVDMLGYRWKAYNELPIIDVGVARDMTTEIITNTDDPGDGGADGSWMFVCRFAEPNGDIEDPGSDGLVLAQVGNIGHYGPEDHNLHEVWDMEWIVGLAHPGDDYCAAILHDFTWSTA